VLGCHIVGPEASTLIHDVSTAVAAYADATTIAAAQTTESAEFGDVHVSDAAAASYDNPILVYDLAHGDEGTVDTRVYDTMGNSSRTDGDGVRQWRKVYATSHDFSGQAVLSNGLVRLRVDDALSVEQWDDGTSSWGSASLGSSSWSLWDLDLRDIGPESLRAQVRFTDGTDVYPLDCHLLRGYSAPLWLETGSSGSIPSGLEDKL
jgi:hypothetical protein